MKTRKNKSEGQTTEAERTEHIPTPWKAYEKKILGNPLTIKGEYPSIIGFMVTNEDTEFIVRAVNSHEALLDALESLVNVDEEVDSLPFDSKEREYKARIEKAKQAIKQAEGL